MAICPKCKKEIEVLSFSDETYGKFYIDNQNLPEYNAKGGNGKEFFCPECDHKITDEEDEAIDFLNNAI